MTATPRAEAALWADAAARRYEALCLGPASFDEIAKAAQESTEAARAYVQAITQEPSR